LDGRRLFSTLRAGMVAFLGTETARGGIDCHRFRRPQTPAVIFDPAW